MSQPQSSRRSVRGVEVALWFTIVAVFLIVIQWLLATRPAHLYGLIWVFGLVQAAVGLGLARRAGLRLSEEFSLAGWPWAVMVLVAVQCLQYALVTHGGPRLTVEWLLIELAKYLIIIGLVEELWFRGLWFRLFEGRAFACIVGGAVVFGLYHLPHGLGTVLTTTSVGLVYGVARFHGASLLTLVVVHALMNWLNMAMLPGIELRVGAETMTALFCTGCILAAALGHGAGHRLASRTSTPVGGRQ